MVVSIAEGSIPIIWYVYQSSNFRPLCLESVILVFFSGVDGSVENVALSQSVTILPNNHK